MRWPILVVFVVNVFQGCSAVSKEEDLDFTAVDVQTLATNVHGTELLVLENSYKDENMYRLEDFFWTGSGDGPPGEEWMSSTPTTVYETKTILATVFVNQSSTSNQNETKTSFPPKCLLNCTESPLTPKGEISPTPTLTEEPTEPEEEGFFDADRQFWLLTVLKSDGKDPVIVDLKNSLAKLYQTAFQRQQERHLGIVKTRLKRELTDKPVNVHIHSVEKKRDQGKIEVLYHVTVDGRPIDAVTAAHDMTLITDQEVREKLGYPFLIKAEPYLKAADPQELTEAKSTWLFIGVSLLGLLVFLLVVAFVILAFTKRNRPQSLTTENRRHFLETHVGIENNGFVGDDLKKKSESPTYINFGNEPSRGTTLPSRPPSSRSSNSSSSSSLDISPLMTLGKKRRSTPPRKPPRPKAALNKTAPLNITCRQIPTEILDSDSSTSRKDSPDTVYVTNHDPGVVSPKSYLSMPSVRSFPRGNIPESLNKILEPVSVHHLDMLDEDLTGLSQTKRYKSEDLVRHGSVGTVEDPGVIGPIVWNMHKRLQHGISMDEGMDDLRYTTGVSKMRKRFHDLLDDTFSLFGSRKDSPVSEKRCKAIPIEVKSHSAINNRPNENPQKSPRPRPKTTEPRRVSENPCSGGPKGAWASSAPSPLIRPLSAGPVAPRVNVDHVLAEGKLKVSDPALPLIAAIKSEIERVSLPGSTAELRR